jgi:glucuronosyltransferase
MKTTLRKIILLLVINQAIAANILYFHDVTSPSHHFWNARVAEALASRGHNVTFLSVDKPGKNKIENLHYVVIEGVYEVLYSEIKYDLMEEAKINTNNKLKSATMATDFIVNGCHTLIKGKHGLEKILSYPDDFKFDLVIYDFGGGPCLLPLTHKFNYPPVIGVTAFLNPSYTPRIVGGHKYPAYVPIFIIDFPQIMNFYQRFYNHLLYWIEIM